MGGDAVRGDRTNESSRESVAEKDVKTVCLACLRRFSGEERNGSEAISARSEVVSDCAASVKWNAADSPESGGFSR